MKKLVVALVLCLMMLASPAIAREITIGWGYPLEIATLPEFVGWKFYYSVDAPGGPYAPLVDVPYAGGGPDYTQKADLPLVLGTHTYYVVGVAFTQTQSSENSNEASVEFTLKLSPMILYSITITDG
jgi:hypothetical protein